MADRSRHTYDVFVSYAHDDNVKPEGTSAKYGWVTTLASNLNTGPNHYRKNLFIDHQLEPGDPFSDDLMAKVEGSTLLLLLLSQNYIESSWCGKELDHFIRTHANDPNKPADVVVVELFPFESLTNVPAKIQNLRKRLTTAKFWLKSDDVSAPRLAGDPTPEESGPIGKVLYWQALHELRNALDSRLRALRSELSSSSLMVGSTPVLEEVRTQRTKTTLGTILLADTTDDLVPQRSAVKAALEPEGVVVLPEGDYVGLSPEEFTREFGRDLVRCELFIQMLSPTVGRTGKGFTAPLPQLQFNGAVTAKRPIMQWCEQLPAATEITDAGHARLFNTPHLRVTSRTSFEREVLERLRAIKQAAERDRSAAEAGLAEVAAKKLIFVDDVAGEPKLNQRLRTLLQHANCRVRSLSQDAALLGNNGLDIVQILKPCHAGITVFADRTKRDVVLKRLLLFLNKIAESSLAVGRWGIYLTPGTARCDLGLVSDEVVAIDEQGLAAFVRGLF